MERQVDSYLKPKGPKGRKASPGVWQASKESAGFLVQAIQEESPTAQRSRDKPPLEPSQTLLQKLTFLGFFQLSCWGPTPALRCKPLACRGRTAGAEFGPPTSLGGRAFLQGGPDS